jgi:hypothetical protein
LERSGGASAPTTTLIDLNSTTLASAKSFTNTSVAENTFDHSHATIFTLQDLAGRMSAGRVISRPRNRRRERSATIATASWRIWRAGDRNLPCGRGRLQRQHTGDVHVRKSCGQSGGNLPRLAAEMTNLPNQLVEVGSAHLNPEWSRPPAWSSTANSLTVPWQTSWSK